MSIRDPLLRRALDDETYRESIARSSDPVAEYLRRAGAYRDAIYEEVQYTDWNGAAVGRGAGEELRAAIPPDATMSFDELAPLLEMGEYGRALVAHHPVTPRATLLELAADPAFAVQSAVLARSQGDEEIRARLRTSANSTIRALLGAEEQTSAMRRLGPEEQLRARAKNPYSRASVATHPDLPQDVLDDLASDPDEDVRFAVAGRRALTPGLIARVVAAGFTPKIMRALVHGAATPPDILARILAESTDSQLRSFVAARASLPRDLVLACARHDDPEVRAAIARNAATETAILDELMNDRNWGVRKALAENPRFTHLDLLATDPVSHVCTVIAKRADASPAVLRILAGDASAYTREALAKRADLPGDLLVKLAKDPSSMVRVAIIARSDVPREVIEALTEDTQSAVRNAAKTALEKLGPGG